MLTFFRSLRHLPQYRHIAAVLTRHGLGWLADQLGLSRTLAWPRRLLRRPAPAPPAASLAQRLCRALEELGPTFVLLGRYLATRRDLLPPELCRELSGLPASGPPMPPSMVVRTVEGALGRPLTGLFSDFAAEPWRCTWLWQVHQARTTAGASVWVFVSNTAAGARLEEDQTLLQDLAGLIDESRPLGWRGAAELWQDWQEDLRQMAVTGEWGHNAERWGHNFAARAGVIFPEVDGERTADGVLTCQALTGRPLRAVIQEEPGPHEELARALYSALAQAIFLDGFYPAPPAWEGWTVLPDGRLALTILAPAGELDSGTRLALWALLESLRDEDLDGVRDGCTAAGLLRRREISAAMCQLLRHLVERYHDLPLEEIALNEVVADLWDLAGHKGAALPAEMGLLLRTLAALQDLGRQLAPRVGAAEELAMVIRQAIAQRHSWAVRGRRIVRAGRSWLRALRSFPIAADRLLSQAVQGDLLLGVEPRGWQKPLRRLERMVTRLILSLLAAGLLMGLALLLTALLPAPWGPWGWILAGGALATTAAVSILLLAASLRREHRGHR